MSLISSSSGRVGIQLLEPPHSSEHVLGVLAPSRRRPVLPPRLRFDAEVDFTNGGSNICSSVEEQRRYRRPPLPRTKLTLVRAFLEMGKCKGAVSAYTPSRNAETVAIRIDSS